MKYFENKSIQSHKKYAAVFYTYFLFIRIAWHLSGLFTSKLLHLRWTIIDWLIWACLVVYYISIHQTKKYLFFTWWWDVKGRVLFSVKIKMAKRTPVSSFSFAIFTLPMVHLFCVIDKITHNYWHLLHHGRIQYCDTAT